jgi:hypothetical protein
MYAVLQTCYSEGYHHTVSFVGRLMIFTALKGVSSESCPHLTPLQFFYTPGFFLKEVIDFRIVHACIGLLRLK